LLETLDADRVIGNELESVIARMRASSDTKIVSLADAIEARRMPMHFMEAGTIFDRDRDRGVTAQARGDHMVF
jgi:hypothetical protein